MNNQKNIAVVIPSYKVTAHIEGVIAAIGSEVSAIYVVDDCCPVKSGLYVAQHVTDPRVKVIYNETNLGVGGATMNGYRHAADDGYDVVVKIDGDGQMNPALITHFVTPILDGRADYCKGNRFYNIEDVKSMPTVRLIGNAALSFFSKLSSGYWNIFDPTNGYTAISCKVVKMLPLDKINNRYFFESDLLFRLGTMKAVVRDIPMKAVYADEVSNLKIKDVLIDFSRNHLKNFCKRIFYTYFLREFSLASLELIFGALLTLFGLLLGGWEWYRSISLNQYASSGTVMLSTLPIILGFQLLLSFIGYDMKSVPEKALTNDL